MTSIARSTGHSGRTSGYAPGVSGYRRVLAALMFGGVANFALLYYVQPLLPHLAERYGIAPAQSAQALSISTLALALGMLLAGPLADRYGRVPVMRASLLASGTLGIASAFAPSWEVLLVLRAADGVALAGLPAVALAYLREEVDAAHHVQANATYITGTAIGGAIGRLVPGPLALLGGWMVATAAMGALTLVAAAVLWILLPPSSPPDKKPRSLRPSAVNGGSGRLDWGFVALCAAGFALMGVFVGVYNAVAFRLEADPFDMGDGVVLVFLAYLAGIPGPLSMGILARRIGRGRASLVGVIGLASGVGVLAVPAVPSTVVGLGVLTFAFLGTHALLSGWIVSQAHRLGASTTAAATGYLLAYYAGSATVGVVALVLWQRSNWTGVTILALGLCVVAGLSVCVAARFRR